MRGPRRCLARLPPEYPGGTQYSIVVGGVLMDFNDHPLWKFSLAVYSAPGVSAVCLELQERRGADVNLGLFAAFVGWSGRGRLETAVLRNCREAGRERNQGAVQALRALRRSLKGDLGALTPAGGPALPQRVAALEIEAAQLQQQVLAPPPPAGV